MGIRSTQKNYYENLFRKTTASYRAKIDKDNKTQEKISCLNDIQQRIDKIGESVAGSNGEEEESILRLRRPRSGAENKENHRPTTEVDSHSHRSSTKRILDDYYRDWQMQRTLKNVDEATNNRPKKQVKLAAAEFVETRRSPTWKERMSFADVNQNPNQKKDADQQPKSVRAVIHDAIVQELQHQFEKTFKIDLKKKMAYNHNDGGVNVVYNASSSSDDVLGKHKALKRQQEGIAAKGRKRVPPNTPASTSSSRSRTISPHAERVAQNGHAYSVLSIYIYIFSYI